MQVQEIKDVVQLGISVVELVDSVADGVSLGDIFQVVGVLKKVKPAIDAVKSGKLLDEYKALDQTSKDELVKWFDSELELKEDKVEAVVEQVWAVILDLNSLAGMVKP
jgi:hypothetical protein